MPTNYHRNIVTGGESEPPRLLIAEGDSWFDFPWGSILDGLRSAGYQVKDIADHSHTLRRIVSDSMERWHWSAWRDLLWNRLYDIPKPCAILLCGGGNDLIERLRLEEGYGGILKQKMTRQPLANINDAINDENLTTFLESLRDDYIRLIKFMSDECNKRFKINNGNPIPILIHGYANPVPDGRKAGQIAFWSIGPWLKPVFEDKGYNNLAENIMVMAVLVDRFNGMLAELNKVNKLGHVHHVDLREYLSNNPSDASFAQDWHDEIHPGKVGIEKIVKVLEAALDNYC